MLHVTRDLVLPTTIMGSYPLSAHSVRISPPSCSHSLRMCSHCGENNAQTSVAAHIL